MTHEIDRARRHLTPSQIAHAIAAMKPYEERKARERQVASGEKFGRGKVGADLHQPIPDTGRTAEKLAETNSMQDFFASWRRSKSALVPKYPTDGGAS